MTDICSEYPECNKFKVGGGYTYDANDDDDQKEKFLYCKKICEEEDKNYEINRQTDIDRQFEALNSDLSERQNEMSTTDQFVKDTTQLWRFEKNKFIFLIMCLILISLCALYMVYKNME